MPVSISGSAGITTVDGSNTTPSISGASSPGTTGISFPGANTMAISTSDVEVARFDSSGGVGLGMSSPTGTWSSRLVVKQVPGMEVAGPTITVDGAQQAIYISNNSTTGVYFSVAANTVVGDIGTCNRIYSTGSVLDFGINARTGKRLSFGTGQIERMAVESDGRLNLITGQLQFPATQNSTNDANTLDDYEEGTWTPTWTNATGSFTTDANYVKIGRVVYVAVKITPTTGTISGTRNSTQFTLPFVVSKTGIIGSTDDAIINNGIGSLYGSSAAYTPSYSSTYGVYFSGFYFTST